MARPECLTIAKVGITSGAYVATMLEPNDTQTLIVSLGANDDGSVATEDNLRELRRTVKAQSVIWLLPGLKDPQRAIIRDVARSYGDRLVDTRPQAGPDHLHPTGMGYRFIAEETEQSGLDAEPVEVAEAEEPGFRAARLSAHRLIASRTVAERLAIGRADARRTMLPVPPAPPAARGFPTVVHATERTTLSDGSRCIRVDARVTCQMAPHQMSLIDPLRDHRRPVVQTPSASASPSQGLRRQALAN